MAAPAARTRRASRAATTVRPGGDENMSVDPVKGPALAGSRISRDKLGLGGSTLPGKSAASSTVGARRALGDVSNATRVPGPDRTSKDSIAIKPTRSRPGSQSSVTTVDLKVSKPAPSVKAPPPAAARRPLAGKFSTQSLREAPAPAIAARTRSRSDNGSVLAVPGAPRIGAFTDEEAGLAPASDQLEVLDSQPAGVGLGLVEDHASDDASSAMQVDRHPMALADADEADEGEYSFSSRQNSSPGHNAMVEADDPDNWLVLQSAARREARSRLEQVRGDFAEELDFWDTTMVAEYAEEIFAYMSELEVQSMPNPSYMEFQTEIEWSMRATLIDWLLQVHLRYHMLPETLWIAVNIVDRFLSNRVVSLVKLQLVGVTAMFIAAKYEEIMAPSVEEFVYMTENGYTREEILKGERIILQSLDFNVSPYCTPYSWVRRISKADDYDIQTRTLSKFLMEVTLLDHRFLRAKPSMIAAIGMFTARRMLGGDWNEAFIYYSGFTEAELALPFSFLIESLVQPDAEEKFVFKKYANKKYLKASIFARNWAKSHPTSA